MNTELSIFGAIKVILITKWYIRRRGWSESAQEIIDVCKDRLRGKRLIFKEVNNV